MIEMFKTSEDTMIKIMKTSEGKMTKKISKATSCTMIEMMKKLVNMVIEMIKTSEREMMKMTKNRCTNDKANKRHQTVIEMIKDHNGPQ